MSVLSSFPVPGTARKAPPALCLPASYSTKGVTCDLFSQVPGGPLNPNPKNLLPAASEIKARSRPHHRAYRSRGPISSSLTGGFARPLLTPSEYKRLSLWLKFFLLSHRDQPPEVEKPADLGLCCQLRTLRVSVATAPDGAGLPLPPIINPPS